MKTLKIILISIALLLSITLVAGLIIVRSIKKGALPRHEGELSLNGLYSDVKVYRDERGMPHIYAENEHDLYFATGYVSAQERLWQMDLIRRATNGRLSEIFGREYVQTDLFLRSLDMAAKSKLVLSTMDTAVINCLKSYAQGVNEYIGEAGKKLPPEFRILGYRPDPWQLEDIANIIGYMGWDLAGGNLAADVFNYRLFSKLGYEKASTLLPDLKIISSPVFPDFRLDDTLLRKAIDFIASADRLKDLGIVSFSGSNNWALSGTRTTTGLPILSNDMHLGLSSPGIWIQMHQVVPGKLNVTGVVVPGEPFVVAGHNERVAWGMTNLMVDDIDLFSEKINPDDPGQYYFNGEWKDLSVRKEVIRIKAGSPDTLTLSFTHRGPVISGFQKINDAVLSMKWSGYDESDEITAVYRLNRAGNWNDFRLALSTFRSVSQNFIYADIEGNIGLNTGGGIPAREGNGSIIRNGDTSRYDWKGYVPFEQLPVSYNPLNGQVSSANNKTTNDNYPYYIAFRFFPPFRIERIRQMLNEKEKFGIDDFRRMIADQHSEYAALLTPFILRIDKDRLDYAGKECLRLLAEWDYDMNKDLTAPALFEFFRKKLSENLLQDELGELYDQLPGVVNDNYIYRILKKGPDEWVDNISTPQKETLDEIVAQSFNDAIAALTGNYGSVIDSWKWGDIHRISLDHPLGRVKLLDMIFSLNSPSFRIGGSNHTVCPYSYGEGFKVTDGASERHIFNLADWDESLTVIPTGISGVPSDEFYLSQTQTYIDGEFYKDHFSANAVKASAKYVLDLKVKKPED